MHHGKQLHVPSFAGDQQQAAASGSSSPARRPAYMTVYGDVFYSPDNLKARILAHPLFEQLLAAHVACLRIAAPVDHYHTIDSTSVDFLHIASKYFATSRSHRGDMGASPRDKEELHQFMVSYILLLELFKQKLQEQFSKQACDAISACREIEQAFYNLTGVSVGPGNGSMMPGDGQDGDSNNYLINYSSSEPLRIDPVLPYDINKSLVDHVRRELKNELKKDYQPKLKDVHEEIRRKRRAGKLPEDKTHVLKEWWTTHACWPYPTEEEKARLVEESGLQLKQINNWFINQRKRNWQAEASNQHMFTSDEASMDRSSLVNISLSLNNDMHESSNKQCP